MRFPRLLAVPALVVIFLSSAVPFARAAATSATATQCFCYVSDGTSGNNAGGAKKADASDDATCATVCAKNGTADKGHQWAKSFAQWPSGNLRCWEKRENCEKDLDGLIGREGTTIDGQWSYGQPAECSPGSHYCYSADTIKTYLQVEIAGVKSVVNFADYVGLVYQYLMGFSMTVAIVLLMVGGLRYVIGATSGDVTKAKKMMTNAVEGFVLLMFAYVILYTVNPQLLKLQVPKLPMLRKVTIVSGDDCGTLLGAEVRSAHATTMALLEQPPEIKEKYGDNAWKSTNGVVVEFDKGANLVCGTDAVVHAGPGGEPVAEGKICKFNYCDNADAGCAAVKDKAECLLCAEVGPKNTNGVSPSSSLCASLDPADTIVNEAGVDVVQTYKMCGHSRNLELVNFSVDIAGDYIAGTCAYLSIDCKVVDTCEKYDNQKVETEKGFWDEELDDLFSPSEGNPNIVSVCQNNPCRVPGGCEYIYTENAALEDFSDCYPSGTAVAAEDCIANLKTHITGTAGMGLAYLWDVADQIACYANAK